MNNLRFYRTELRLPLDAMAHMTGLSRWVIRAIELGFRKALPDEETRICSCLGYSVREVFPETKMTVGAQ